MFAIPCETAPLRPTDLERKNTKQSPQIYFLKPDMKLTRNKVKTKETTLTDEP